ncbi:MAG: Unknown protein [uncultured Thiotrichaceae bacterium]|uniref:Zona occludens toxin N-terminal domain-containing protein n=1 Tax=uncultured Thiotrichaceae bacterium TaxID=298394 RepID=A0A6S6TQJ6_9GAMM|nr:MAG: Unknown protein [uncultured Thiotrichaceae bacterium]
MSIKIHHGPPGTSKTSDVIANDLPKVVDEGRLLITNIHGLDDVE